MNHDEATPPPVSRNAWLLMGAGLLAYLVIFATIFVERDGIPTYEAGYGLFVLLGATATLLTYTAHLKPAIILSAIALAANLTPFLFLFWVLLPQGLILTGTLHHWRAARLDVPET